MSPFWGLAIGFAVLWVSEGFRPKKLVDITPESFWTKYPNKRWIYFLLFNLPFLWLMVWVFLMPAILGSRLADILKGFFVTFTIFAGIGLLDGLLETITLVSVKRKINFARGFRRRLVITYGIQNRQLGLGKIVSIIAVAIIWFVLATLLV